MYGNNPSYANLPQTAYGWRGQVKSSSGQLALINTDTPGTFSIELQISPTTGKALYDSKTITVVGTKPSYRAVETCPPDTYITNEFKGGEQYNCWRNDGSPPFDTPTIASCPQGGNVVPGVFPLMCAFADTPPPPPPPPSGGSGGSGLPDPPPPPSLTSITISPFAGGAGSGFGTMYDGVKRAYTVNEVVGTTVVGWYVNDTRAGTGAQFNFKGNPGDRIYAILDPDKGGSNAGLQGGVRSNTFVFNPSGADGAGEQGVTPGDTDDKDHDIDGDGIHNDDDDDMDGDGVHNNDDDDIDGDGTENHLDPTPTGTLPPGTVPPITYDTLYTRASQAQYLGDVFHADPTHTNPTPEKVEGSSLPTPLLIMAGLAGGFLIYNNSKKR